MASYIGRVGEFCRDKETFCAYVEHMEMFYTANNIVETPGTEHMAANRRITEQKKAIFLAEVSPEVYSVLSNLLSPAKPKNTSLADIVQTLKNHYNSITIVLLWRLQKAFTSECEINKRMSRLVITLWL